MARRSVLALCTVVLLVGCKPPDRWKIVTKMDLKTPRGDPEITGVDDLGSVPLIMNKPLERGGGDGVAVVGELLVIRGENLGRQPRVTFGEKPMAVLARTEDGGIVVRAPAASTPGEQQITVTNGQGSGSHTMQLKRYGLAVVPGLPGIQVLEVGVDKIEPRGKAILATSPGYIDLHRDGSVAYATTGGKEPKLLVVDLAAAGGPRMVTQRKLGMWKALGLSVASEAKVAAVVHEKAILLFHLDDPRDPMRYNPVRFPPGVYKRGVVDIRLSPDGRTLAVLMSRGNSLVLFDVSDPNRVRNTSFIPLLPEAKDPLVRRMHFSYSPRATDKQILWVAVSDTPASQRSGKHAPRLLKYAVRSAPDRASMPELKPLGEISLPGERSVLDFTSSYAVRQIVSASVIRREPSRMSFLLSMAHPDLFMLEQHRLDTPTGLQNGAELLRRLGSFGTILKTDSKGRGEPLHTMPGVASVMAITGDGRQIMAITCTPKVSLDPPRVEIPCGVLAKPTTDGPARTLRMGMLPLASFRPPFGFGVLALQP